MALPAASPAALFHFQCCMNACRAAGHAWQHAIAMLNAVAHAGCTSTCLIQVHKALAVHMAC